MTKVESKMLGPTFQKIAQIGVAEVQYRRSAGEDVSEAHSESHLRNVANTAIAVGQLLGFNFQEKLLVYYCGWTHDMIRNPTEDPQVKDDEASANAARNLLQELTKNRIISSTREEQDAVYFAIANHGRYPDWLNDPQTRNNPPQNLQDKLWLALFVADKMDANGARVIARRSSFVAGDRLKGEKGDWKTFGFIPDRDEHLVVAIESILRLTFINPEEVYPDTLLPLVHPLYEAQREFVLGICKASGLQVEDLARILLEKKTTEGRNIIEVRKINAPENLTDLVSIIAARGQITDEKIAATSEDVSDSAQETVNYFSGHYRDNLDQLVKKWRPAGKTAQNWQKAMAEYNDGSWLNGKKEEFALARSLKENTKHDEALMPLRMGAAVRVPEYAYSAWGLAPMDETQVVDLYRAEWDMGNQNQLALVTQASEKSGFGNNPELLRHKTAEVVAALLKDYPVSTELRILDVGAGPGLSAKAVYDALPEDLKRKTKLFLLDPSEASLLAARKLLEEHEVNFEIIHDVDLNLGKYVGPGSIDILTGVASIHHHARIPFDIYYQMLKAGGYAIFADWHNSNWEHPSRVLDFLRSFHWPQRTEGLRHWQMVYPNAHSSIAKPDNPADQRANEDIIRFWQGYAEVVRQNDHLGSNAIWPLEGHRPVERYIEAMEDEGFSLNSQGIKRLIEQEILESNPHQVLPDSRLLMVTVGQKV